MYEAALSYCVCNNFKMIFQKPPMAITSSKILLSVSKKCYYDKNMTFSSHDYFNASSALAHNISKQLTAHYYFPSVLIVSLSPEVLSYYCFLRVLEPIIS